MKKHVELKLTKLKLITIQSFAIASLIKSVVM